jgi:uncharacterized protein YecE (DUF72 family)
VRSVSKYMVTAGNIRIGISGWLYPGWRGIFYPKTLKQKDELSFAASAFRTIEINGTFYSLKRPEYFAAWRAQTPDGFQFAVKGSRYITHMLKLTNCEAALANFFGSGVLRLKEKLGPFLWQFPQRFRFEPEKLAPFFDSLPRDTKQAARLARNHDRRIAGRAWTKAEADLPLRHAVEVRHESFRNPDFVALLRKHKVGLVVTDGVGWPLLMDVTADFVYCRLHGSAQLYASGYDLPALRQWAKRALTWAQGGELSANLRVDPRPAAHRARRDVFIYFDNDAKVRAPFDAQELEREVGALLGRGKSAQGRR